MTVEAGIETFRAPSNPKWIEELSPEHREEYEIVKAEDIDENTERMEALIVEHLGDSLDTEAVHDLAVALAEKVRAALDSGIQIGMDEKQVVIDQLQREVDRSASFQRNVVGN